MGGDEQEVDARQHDQGKYHGDRQIVQAPVQTPFVSALQPVEAAVDVVGELLLPAAMLRIVRLEKPRAQHRRERERDNAGNGHGANQREGEFGKQRAGEAALEADRHVNRAQHNGHGDDRPAELARGVDGGRNRRDALFEMAADVFDHDNGVVDDETDSEHKRQQREQIDRIAERQQDNERPDQRKRNGDSRYERRTHRAKEHEDDERDDDQRLDQAQHHLVDRGIHEFGGVVDNLAVEPARQLRLDVRPDLVHTAHHLQQIGGRRDLNADIDRLLAVEADLGFIVLGAKRDVGDVLQAYHRPVRLFDDEIAELLGRMQAGRCGEVDLHHLALGRADAGNVVVGGERLTDVGRGQPVCGELLRIEPGAQREHLLAEQLRGLHARYGLQLGLHDAREIIGDLVRRQRIAVEPEIHRVDGLADLDGQDRLLRPGRQLIEDRVDLGVDFGQRLVGIVVEPQIDRDRAGAALAGRRHVVDAVGLGDGDFERRGDEARHHVGIGAVIGGGDGHDRVLGARILQHRQRVIGAHAEHQDQQADDRSEDRPANEDVGEVHGGAR